MTNIRQNIPLHALRRCHYGRRHRRRRRRSFILFESKNNRIKIQGKWNRISPLSSLSNEMQIQSIIISPKHSLFSFSFADFYIRIDIHMA